MKTIRKKEFKLRWRIATEDRRIIGQVCSLTVQGDWIEHVVISVKYRAKIGKKEEREYGEIEKRYTTSNQDLGLPARCLKVGDLIEIIGSTGRVDGQPTCRVDALYNPTKRSAYLFPRM